MTIATIYGKGDSSVGIADYQLEIDLGEIDIVAADDRQQVREATVTYGEALSGQNCRVLFSDECHDCGSPCIGVCSNQNCISHAPED